MDFRALLDGPAGKHGFLTTRPDGHFYFQDGVRARFWGISIASSSIFQSPDTISQVVGVLARAGINLVRFHEMDSRGGVIDYRRRDSQHLLPDKLDILDRWIAACKREGIYVYLDLLDYRSFRHGDGLPNAALMGRGAKPYALFDRRLIQLQKQYAADLLVRHVNRYTGLSYSRDPAVCLLELFDENGLFIKGSTLTHLVWPYSDDLKRSWNRWLRARYGSTAALARAWTRGEAKGPLAAYEHPESGTVELPSMSLFRAGFQPGSRLHFAGRCDDGALFLYRVESSYFSEMKGYLQQLGVRIPITAVGSPDAIPDTRAIAENLDFTGTNFYWDHPKFTRNREWVGPTFFHARNPLRSMDMFSFAPTLAFSRVAGKPLVVREWTYCWPNRYRAEGMVEAAVYASLQDVDAMILFAYDTGPKQRDRVLTFFDASHDPSRWSFVGPMAAVFLKGLIAPARSRVSVGYSWADTFHFNDYQSSLYDLAWESQVQNLFFRDTLPGRLDDLVVASGHSASAGYLSSRTVIRTLDPYEGLPGKYTWNDAAHRSGYSVASDYVGSGDYSLWAGIYPRDAKIFEQAGRRFRIAAVRAAGYVPLGIAPDSAHCLGFYDEHRQNYVFHDVDEITTLRAGLDGLHEWSGGPDDVQAVHRDDLLADTRQLARDSAAGSLRVNSPLFQAICGKLAPPPSGSDGLLGVRCPSTEGTAIALSLDGEPLNRSQHILLQMAGGTENTGERLRYLPSRPRAPYVLERGGRGPVVSNGRLTLQPVEVFLNGNRLASIYVDGGVWMLAWQPERSQFYCDTPYVRAEVPRFSSPALTRLPFGVGIAR